MGKVGEHWGHPSMFPAASLMRLHARLAAPVVAWSWGLSVILRGVYFPVSCYLFAYIQFTVPVI